MRDGAIVAEGAPADVVTEELVRDVFDFERAGWSPTRCPARRWSCPSAATSTSPPSGRGDVISSDAVTEVGMNVADGRAVGLVVRDA